MSKHGKKQRRWDDGSPSPSARLTRLQEFDNGAVHGATASGRKRPCADVGFRPTAVFGPKMSTAIQRIRGRDTPQIGGNDGGDRCALHALGFRLAMSGRAVRSRVGTATA